MIPTLTPAYCRDYKSGKEAKADFLGGKDFIYNAFDGYGYCNRQDLSRNGIKQVNIRYKKLTMVVCVKF